jgi:hypothetical protein
MTPSTPANPQDTTGGSEVSERVSYLLLTDFERVEEWCRGIRILFGQPPYMVGSANERPDYRDIDLRLILADDDFDAAWRNPVKLRLMNRAMSTWGQRETGLPIDFQIQRQSEANRTYPEGARTPMGVRDWRTNVPAAVLVDEVGANPQEEREQP